MTYNLVHPVAANFYSCAGIMLLSTFHVAEYLRHCVLTGRAINTEACKVRLLVLFVLLLFRLFELC